VNQGSALWARAKKDIGADEYNAFYTALTYDPEPPAITLHNRVEGKMEYISLLYVPAKAPFDLWDREQRRGIKLYVRRIFIAEDAKRLMPNYLRFVRGLIDSADLPLNVSREFLQNNAALDKIRAASVKKVLVELTRLAAKQPQQYAALWREYGRVIKEGVVEDGDNRKAISALLRFASTHTARSDETPSDEKQTDEKDAQSVSLDDYVARMPAEQKAIYYVTADSLAAAKSSPHLEALRARGVEVLLLFDPVDEWVVGHLAAHGDKPLQSIAKGDLDFADLSGDGADESPPDDDGASDDADQSAAMQPLVDKLQAALADQVKAVRLSSRLVDSPACLVADQHDLGGNMERILQAVGQNAPRAKPILEINPHHAIVRQIDAESELADDWARVLFDHAALAEGAPLQDPGAYVKRINKLLAR
ncbi:MAG: molecular chaperone HtpG, partial [bacterium]